MHVQQQTQRFLLLVIGLRQFLTQRKLNDEYITNASAAKKSMIGIRANPRMKNMTLQSQPKIEEGAFLHAQGKNSENL